MNFEKWVWPHFRIEEVLPPRTHPKHVNPYLLDALEELRASIGGSSIFANDWHRGGKLRHRGFRTYWQNRRIGGYPTSLHLLSRAIDIHCPLLAPEELGEHAIKFFNEVLIYPKKGFVHCGHRFGNQRFKIVE